MADDQFDDGDVEINENGNAKKDKQSAEQDKALDTLTDMAPERQMDENKVKQAMSKLAASRQADKEAQRAREAALAAVKVDKADVDLIAAEMEVDKKVA
eukprot:CAMPEP_0202874170 /NCGR_PEP_ID=MMETSP1391-20130828/24870_1 /ASSEMBLY_ACC=CAM_ASM_000867 /TAXON_ID=1034604 /ORGANISM="Chlamydomonas leiostraca, Strain SAG 11-49" /LENGTH=98 /DNA_ID=CAMNT_0049555547 /DNA_START=79 /DNA_END=372 /DNA_ORIENTATION=-